MWAIPPTTTAMSVALRILGRVLGWPLLALAMLLAAAWVAGAVFFDGPFGDWNALLAAGLVAALAAVLVFVRGGSFKVLAFFAVVAAIVGWWFTLEPGNHRHWQPDVAQTPWAESDGEVITLHNLRRCEYRTSSDYTPRWETRTVRLSQLTGLDFFVTYWGSPHTAHPIASFQFADGPPVCFSIETRKEMGEGYSALAGFFRQYELVYVMADERDVIRVRTNFRTSEDVYLFRYKTPAPAARVLFLDYLRRANRLNKEPEWYNALTDNCSTGVRLHSQAAGNAKPWDWRLLLNGHMDARAYDLGMLDTSLSFADLKRLSRINGRARLAGDAPDFSARIRDGLPGFAAEEAKSQNPNPK
jgi:hypothetical protein